MKILKHGSLLKKKDILAGWQSRYFVLQQERVSYFLDEFTYRSGKKGMRNSGDDDDGDNYYHCDCQHDDNLMV